MKNFCRILWCCGCSCCQPANPLKSLNEHTRLLPKSDKNNKVFEKNEIYMFGEVPEDLKQQATEVEKINKTFVKKIVCGKNHFLVLFNNNELAISGSNEQGQLGLPLGGDKLTSTKFEIFKPEIEGNKNYEFIDIAAGENFSMVLIRVKQDFILYKFGISLEDRYAEDLSKVKTINQVKIGQDVKIRNIYCFGLRSLILTDDNSILVGGIDFSLNSIKKIKVVDNFPKLIKSLCLGSSHALLLDNEGGVYSFGDNTYGELGHENVLTIEKPTKISFFDTLTEKVKKICVGARHSMVLMESGVVYVFGDNSDGQCTGQSSRYPKPTPINFESKEIIIDLYCGHSHVLLLTNLGNLYSWGDSANGKLGFNEGNLIINVPKEIQSLKGKNINHVSLGQSCTAISTSTYDNSIVNILSSQNQK